MTNLAEHDCEAVGWAKGSKVHPDLPVFVAINKDEALGLLLSQWTYVLSSADLVPVG